MAAGPILEALPAHQNRHCPSEVAGSPFHRGWNCHYHRLFCITGRYSCLLFTGASFAFWGSNIFNRRHRPLLVLLQLIVGKVDLHSGRLGDRPGGVRGRRGGRLEEVIVIVEGGALDDGG
ncbi:hypothetical protein TYRP_004168 [Tyrophagus putrescentiae]|nr:hypothetical protein TYRP_004168 [Tyrophagus putrescentiae]